MPVVDVFHRLEPAPVVERAAELGEPRAQAVGDAVGHPDANLLRALHRILPAVGLLHSHAENAPDGLAAEGGAVLLAVLAVGPGGHQAAAGLAVGKQRGRQLADGLHVQVAERAAAGVGDVARRGIDLADLGIPQAPQLEQALLVPHDVVAPRGILRVGGARQVQAAEGVEIPPAVLAVAHAGAGPAIAEDAVHVVEGDDLLGHLGHELEIVGTQRAGHPQLRRRPVAPLVALGVHGDPVRVGVVDILVRGVRIGAGDDDHVHLAAAGDQVAERVGGPQPGTAIVQRDFGWVEGHAAAGAEAGGVGVSAPEIVEPESGSNCPGSFSTSVNCAQRMGRSNQPASAAWPGATQSAAGLFRNSRRCMVTSPTAAAAVRFPACRAP